MERSIQQDPGSAAGPLRPEPLFVNLGFNSNVRLGNAVYHVQTEDRGREHPFIDTTVYDQGRVVHRRTTTYQDLLALGRGGEAALQQRVERQHREVVEELRVGVLKLAAPTSATARARAAKPGIAVQLLNPASWLAGGAANSQIEVRSRDTNQPVANVNIEVMLEGAQGPARFAAFTDPQGCAELNFPLPRLGPGGAALVIRAWGPGGEDEIRYQLRPKARASAPPGHKS
ncbi:MAG: hypothetical protein HY237_02210 [Acidobacteria bacterium]|nr:hypothetical protein [Acidobacteriota bacterium]